MTGLWITQLEAAAGVELLEDEDDEDAVLDELVDEDEPESDELLDEVELSLLLEVALESVDVEAPRLSLR